MKYRIAQIIPYFGRWPEWIDLYLYSCSRNPMIDFIFYTDCPMPQKVYSNTIMHKCSYKEYKLLVGKRLGIDYNIEKPYKLTDLKPFIGLVHEEELKGYDFWGFGDLDLVYGDLSLIINERNLEKYDLITTHSYHIAGHFTICRNNKYYRNRCLEIENWKIKLTEDKHHALDEGEWSNIIYPAIRYVRFIYNKILKRFGVSFWNYMEKANRLVLCRKLFLEYYTSPAPKPGETWIYHLETNKVFNPIGKELPYLHFLFFKKTPYYKTENYWKSGYYMLDRDFSKSKFIKFNHKGIYAE